MNRTEVLQYLFILSTIFLVNNAHARLKGEAIVGGDDAREGDFGYQISFQFYNRHMCGGAIIAERYVVTAAHCVIDQENGFIDYAGPMKVVAGVQDLKINSARKVSIDVEEIFVPSEYDRRIKVDSTGDIAVLKLRHGFNLKKRTYLSKVELPNSGDVYTSVTAMVSGFGANEVDVRISPKSNNEEVVAYRSFEKLRYAKVHVENDQDKVIFASIVQRDPSKPEGICGGDSGGPLVYDDKVIGVVSGSAGDCRDDRQPAIYTSVASFVDFIRKALDGNIDKDVRHVILRNYQSRKNIFL